MKQLKLIKGLDCVKRVKSDEAMYEMVANEVANAAPADKSAEAHTENAMELADNVTAEFTLFDIGNATTGDQVYSELGAIIDSYEPKTTVASGGNENPEVSFKKDTYKGEVKLGDIFKLNN